MSDIFNIHEPIYRHIEDEVIKLSYSICFDDYQLKTYSPKISELILRIATEIEAISIELHQRECKKPDGNISYIRALEELNTPFNLSDLCLLITLEGNCFSSRNKLVSPFKGWDKWEQTEDGKTTLGSWHCAYQYLKHNNDGDKYSTMQKYGTLEQLIKILSSLYVLNFLWGGSGKFALRSKVFSVIQKTEDGSYGIWTRSYSGRYQKLDNELSELME